MVYKTWCTIRQKLASFLWDASSKELVKIGEDEYYEERIIERDDKRYVLLRSVADPTAALVRRICEYYETIEDETELQGTLKEFKIQCDLTKRKSKNRCLAFIIAVVILTVAAIVGNSWLIRNWESSVFEHELICYCLIAVCVCMVNNRVCKRKSITASVLFTSGFAIVFSILVFLLNNWWRYHRLTRTNTPDSVSFRRFLPFSPYWASAQLRLKSQKSLENTSLAGASSFVGAEMCPDKKRPAGNTCRIAKGFDAVWAHFCPSKPCLPLSTDGIFMKTLDSIGISKTAGIGHSLRF